MRKDNRKGFITFTGWSASVKYWGLRYLLGDIFSKTVRYYKEHGFWKTISEAYSTFSKRGGISLSISGISSSREKEKCKVCNSGDLVFLEKKLNIDGESDDIYICPNCLVIADLSNRYHESTDVSSQRESSADFYKYTADEIKNLEFLVECNMDIVRSVIPYLGRTEDKVLLEVGSGRGLLLVAASKLGFKKVIGVDYNTTSFEETKRHTKVEDNVFMFSDIKSIPIEDKADCFVMWHTLEHILEPNGFLRSVNRRLSEGCILFIQVPQYNQPYLCRTHYYFYNEPSIRVLLSNNGFHIFRIEYDLKSQFMTVVAKRVRAANGLRAKVRA